MTFVQLLAVCFVLCQVFYLVLAVLTAKDVNRNALAAGSWMIFFLLPASVGLMLVAFHRMRWY